MSYNPFALCIVVVVTVGILALAVVVTWERLGKGYVSEDDLWRPCWRSVHPGWLLAVRNAAFLYLLSVLVYDFVLHGPFIYEYYTQWSFTLLLIYFALALITSARQLSSRSCERRDEFLAGYSHGDDMENGDELELDEESQGKEAGTAGYISQVIFQTVAGAALLTDMVYWILIYPTELELDFISISMHAVNLALLLLEISLNNLSFPWFRGGYFILWSGLFSIFTWTIHVLGENVWPYPFLDVSLKLAPFWYFILCIGHIVAYGMMCIIIFLKNVFVRYSLK